MEPLIFQEEIDRMIDTLLSYYEDDENVRIIKGEHADLIMKRYDLRIRIKKCGFDKIHLTLQDPQMNGSLTDISELCTKLLSEFKYLDFHSNGELRGIKGTESVVLAKYKPPTVRYLLFLIYQLRLMLTGYKIEETTETELKKKITETAE